MTNSSKLHRLFAGLAIVISGSLVSAIGAAPAHAAPQGSQTVASSTISSPSPSVSATPLSQGTVTESTEKSAQDPSGQPMKSSRILPLIEAVVLVGAVVGLVASGVTIFSFFNPPKPVCTSVRVPVYNSAGKPVSYSTVVVCKWEVKNNEKKVTQNRQE